MSQKFAHIVFASPLSSAVIEAGKSKMRKQSSINGFANDLCFAIAWTPNGRRKAILSRRMKFKFLSLLQ